MLTIEPYHFYILAVLAVVSSVILFLKTFNTKDYYLIGSVASRILLIFVCLYTIKEHYTKDIYMWQIVSVAFILLSDISSNIVHLLYRDRMRTIKEMTLIETLGKIEAKNHLILEYCPVAIYSFEAVTGRMNYVNPAMYKALGYNREDILGKSVYSFVSSEYKELVKENVSKRLRNELESLKYDVQIISKNGDRLTFNCEGIIVHNGTTNILGFAIPK